MAPPKELYDGCEEEYKLVGLTVALRWYDMFHYKLKTVLNFAY